MTGVGTLTGEVGTLTGGAGTLTGGTETLTLDRAGVGLAGAIAWPEAYPAVNTQPPTSKIILLAPTRLATSSHRRRAVRVLTPVPLTSNARPRRSAVRRGVSGGLANCTQMRSQYISTPRGSMRPASATRDR